MTASGDGERAMSDREEKAANTSGTADRAAPDRPASKVKLAARPCRPSLDIEDSIQRAMARYPTVRAYLARND